MKNRLLKTTTVIIALIAFFSNSITAYASYPTLTGPMDQYVWEDLVALNTDPYYNNTHPNGSYYWNGRGYDSDHGYIVCTSTNADTVLNRYTSTAPVVGTRLTTWHYDSSDQNMVWRMYDTVDGYHFYLSPVLNMNLFVDIYRTTTNTSTDLIARMDGYQSNYYEDGHIYCGFSTYANFMYGSFYLGARTTNGLTYNERYLIVSSTATPVSDGYGTSKYCMWHTGSGNTFYMESDPSQSKSANLDLFDLLRITR